MQAKHTIYPLYISVIDNKNSSMTKTISACNEEDIKFPVIPLNHNATNRDISFIINKKSKNRSSIKISNKDSKVSTTYYFIHNTCWNLYMIEYESL